MTLLKEIIGLNESALHKPGEFLTSKFENDSFFNKVSADMKDAGINFTTDKGQDPKYFYALTAHSKNLDTGKPWTIVEIKEYLDYVNWIIGDIPADANI